MLYGFTYNSRNDCVYSKCRFPYSLISCDINLVNMELTIGQKILPSREIWYPLISNQHSFDGINFSSSVEIIRLPSNVEII